VIAGPGSTGAYVTGEIEGDVGASVGETGWTGGAIGRASPHVLHDAPAATRAAHSCEVDPVGVSVPTIR
jgi:hypothetical protein